MPVGTSYKEVWKISFPLILGGFAQTAINITDAIFLGRLSETALGASAIAGLFFITIFMLGMGLGIGAQIIIARLDGEMNFKEIGKVFHNIVYLLFSLSVVLLIATVTCGSLALPYFVDSETILRESIEYLDVRAWGFIFAFLMVAFRSLFVGIAKTKIIFSSTVFMALLNVFLNYCFIFGNLGFPVMGIKGAALASVISEVFTVAFYSLFTYKTINIEKYGLFKWYKPVLDYNIRILKISLPMMFQFFISLASWFIFFLIIEKMGERELAISNIVRNIYMIIMVPILGFGSATNTLVSNIIGQKKYHDVIPIIFKVSFLSFIFSLILSLLNILFPELWISFFTDMQDLKTQTVPVLYVISGALMFFSVASILLSGVSGTGNTPVALAIEIITVSFYLIASYYLAVVAHASLSVVWCVEFVYFSLIGLLSFLYLKYGSWHKLKISH